MSRFHESSIACLKSVMLSCAPEFKFKDTHVTGILEKTELNSDQIWRWAENFRRRYSTEKERMDFLTSDRFDKVTGPHSFDSYVFPYIYFNLTGTFKEGHQGLHKLLQRDP
jgi:hypothetical protein